jgi:hypothetical protein
MRNGVSAPHATCKCQMLRIQYLLYGWTGQQSGSGFSDIAGLCDWEFLRLWTGFELPSSWVEVPCYGLNRNRSGLDFMRWSDFDHGAQDLNGKQRPKLCFQNS